ncbi:MAG: hypothetical protein ACRC92_26650 [Peptostreptococcaceae bacterium]
MDGSLNNLYNLDRERTYIFIDDVLVSNQYTLLLNLAKIAANGDEYGKLLFDALGPLYDNNVVNNVLRRDVFHIFTKEQEEWIVNHKLFTPMSITSRLCDNMNFLSGYGKNIRIVYLNEMEKFMCGTNLNKLKCITLDDFIADMEKLVDRRVIVICANPDLIDTFREYYNNLAVYKPKNLRCYKQEVESFLGNIDLW